MFQSLFTFQSTRSA